MHELSIARKAALTASGMVALLAPITVGVIAGRIVHAEAQTFRPWGGFPGVALMAAQTSAKPQAASIPQFEVSSIKPATPNGPQHGRLSRMEALIVTRPGMLSARGVTLKQLIEGAYSVENYQVNGGPDWIESAQFDVDAKPSSAPSRDQLLLMLRPLLTERFKLAFHRGTKEMPVQALTVAKGGPKFQAAKPWPESKPRPRNRLGLNVDMGWVATYLTHLGADIPVIDKTGLAGKYDLDLDMDKIMAAAGAETGNPSISAVFQATVDAMEGLGLRLEREKAPIAVLIVDHAERPSQN